MPTHLLGLYLLFLPTFSLSFLPTHLLDVYLLFLPTLSWVLFYLRTYFVSTVIPTYPPIIDCTVIVYLLRVGQFGASRECTRAAVGLGIVEVAGWRLCFESCPTYICLLLGYLFSSVSVSVPCLLLAAHCWVLADTFGRVAFPIALWYSYLGCCAHATHGNSETA